MGELLRQFLGSGTVGSSHAATPELEQQFEQIGRNPEGGQAEVEK